MHLCFGRAVVLDLGFGYVPTVVELLKLGMFSTSFIKKKRGWPKYTRAEEVLSEINGKDVGTIIARKAKSVEGGYPFFWLLISKNKSAVKRTY